MHNEGYYYSVSPIPLAGQSGENFKRAKNHQNASDWDDFWTESIVSPESIISENFARLGSEKLRKRYVPVDFWETVLLNYKDHIIR